MSSLKRLSYKRIRINRVILVLIKIAKNLEIYKVNNNKLGKYKIHFKKIKILKHNRNNSSSNFYNAQMRTIKGLSLKVKKMCIV